MEHWQQLKSVQLRVSVCTGMGVAGRVRGGVAAE